ncbi:MAG TPA: M20/M25/M40 family metallo-hydrolase [Cellulomonas sp.]
MTTLQTAALDRLPRDIDTLVRYASIETPTGDAAALDTFADVLVADAVALGMHGGRVPLGGARGEQVPGDAASASTAPGSTASASTAAARTGDAVLLDLPGTPPAAGAEHAGSDDRPVLLLVHHDTVHPVGSLAGPVPLHRVGDDLRGPGTYDMKGGIVVALAALALLRDLGLPHRPVRLVSTPDEEVGSPASADLVRSAAVGVRCALGLEAPLPDGTLKTSRRGSTRLRLTVTGRAAHAAIDPTSGVPAIDELVDQLVTVRAVIAEHPDVLANVGTIRGGSRTNVVAAHAEADLGLRFVTPETERAVLDRLTALTPVRPGAELDVRVLSRRPAWGPGPAAGELLAAVDAAARTVGQHVTGAAAPGAADTNLTGAAGVATLDGFGPLGGGAHAVTEHVRVRSIAERAALLAAALTAL